ncbi:hypothetical protein [Jatrophihabitans sp.]|uniref:hypothetical protein n=1 Tax=Jatrophihabitans sp. TaxID=1932789 RepID=UPI0030C65BBC|nr:hypothetical protein [Jatrophihabitans sp.]
MTDVVQEWVMESVLWPERPTNWPPCPHHPRNHPLAAKVVQDRAVWVCPVDETSFYVVGSLPAS